MKRRIFLIIFAIMLVACAMSMAACANGDIYEDLAKDGYTVKIKYDAGGAVVNETQNVTIVEVFNEGDVVTTAEGKTGIKLLSPDDSRRGEGVFRLAKSDGENNYFSPGWYTSRTPRVDGDGQPLDAYGVRTSVSGREQGYVYSGRWNFEKDVVDPKSLENGEMTLYAAWIPFFTYEFYSDNGSGEFELIGSVKKLDLKLPEWNERTGKLKNSDMPQIEGKTFKAAYLDREMTDIINENVDGDTLFIDYEKGIATQSTVRIYTEWYDGDVTKIFDAEQLVQALAARDGEIYCLGADIDLENVTLPDEVYQGAFYGKIYGEGHCVLWLRDKNGSYPKRLEDIFESVDPRSEIYDVELIG